MAPYITPWSVRASAGISSSAARATIALMRLAPSSSENSVWLCRWTKVSGACGIAMGGVVGLQILALPAGRLAGQVEGIARFVAVYPQPVTVAEIATSLRSIPHSGIREISNLAATIPGAIRLEVGQPDFRTPPHIVAAAKRALDEGWHG